MKIDYAQLDVTGRSPSMLSAIMFIVVAFAASSSFPTNSWGWSAPTVNLTSNVTAGGCRMTGDVGQGSTATITFTTGGWLAPDLSAQQTTLFSNMITTPFDVNKAEQDCNLTNVNLVSQSVTPSTGGDFASATNSVLEFTGTEAGGDEYTWRAEINGLFGDIPTLSVTKTVSNTMTVSNTIVEDTQKVIANFITNRANHILNNQPDLISFLNSTNTTGGGPLGNLNLTANSSNMNLAFSSSLSRVRGKANQRINRALDGDSHANPAAEKQTATNEPQTMAYAADWLDKSPTDDGEEKLKANSKDDEEAYAFEGVNGFDVWTEVYGSRSVSGSADSSLWVGYVGVHKLINPDLLIGGLVQMDWADETNSSVNSTADGFGWMIGPYIAGRIPGHSLSYEARASWGRSSNDVSPIGTYTDGFDTTRWMASGKIAGSYRIDDLSINPFISATWFEENQENYTDSLGNSIPEQTVSLGEIRFGPQLMREIVLENGGMISPSFGVSGVWNFGISDNAASQGNALGNDQLRARFEAGVTATDANGWQLIIAGFYDGVGVDDYYAYGGNARLVIPLP